MYRTLENILWTDESRFTNNGMYNRWNFRHWAETKPHITFTSHHQISCSVNVWCGILNSRIIGPYFFEGNLTGQRYLHFLQTVLVDLLSDIPLRTCLLYTSDAADERSSVDLGGRRIIKKKKKKNI